MRRLQDTLNRPSLALTLLLAAAIPLSACADPDEIPAGQVVVCFAGPSETLADPMGDQFIKGLQGTVVFDKPIEDTQVDLYCRETAKRVLQIDVAGEPWSVGYATQDHHGADVTPEVAFEPGQPIHLVMSRRPYADLYYAFSARAENGLFLAMDDGLGTQLTNNNTLDFTVSMGSATGATEDDFCGTRAAHELVFKSEDTVSIDGGERSTITLSDGTATVMNIAAWRYDGDVCMEPWGPNSIQAWVAWRAAPL